MKIYRNFAEHSRKLLEFLNDSEFLKSSEKISWILTEFYPDSDRSKIRMIRSLGNRIIQLCQPPQEGRADGEPLAAADAQSNGPAQGWKIRFPSDRIIRIFEHQNSVEILSEFSKIIMIFQKFWQVLGLLDIF